jgi:hypothetical protein
MLHIESSYSEFEDRFEEVYDDPDALKELYVKTERRAEALWNDFMKSGRPDGLREEYDKFRDLSFDIRRRRIRAIYQ